MKELRRKKREEQKKGRHTKDIIETEVSCNGNGSVEKVNDKAKWKADKDFLFLETYETEATEATEDEMVL